MTATDVLRRAERRATASRYTPWVLGILLFVGAQLGLATVIHRRGVAEGRALERGVQTQKALNENREKLRLDAIHEDSVRKEVAAVDTAAHVVSRRVAVAHQVEDSTRARLDIKTDSTVSVDSQPPQAVDPAIVAQLRAADQRRSMDSLAILIMGKQIDARDRDRSALRTEIADWVARDSLHVERETELAADVKTEGRRGFWKGVKVGVVGTVGVLGTVVVALAVLVK